MQYTTDELLELSQDSCKPTIALVVYKNKNTDYYIESHDINERGQMQEGVPLTRQCISELVTNFSAEYSHTPFGLIPENMLYIDHRMSSNRYVWYNPPCRRMMYFAKGLNIPNALYFVPGVVYDVQNDKLDIYAFKGKKPTDKLYKAPFFNVTDAQVCIGNADVKYPDNPGYSDLLLFWEKIFWLSEFSHLGGGGNPTKSNLYLATQKWTGRFDYSELLPSTTTLKTLLL